MIEDDDVEFEGQVFHPSWSYRNCLREAGKLGIPDEKRTLSKALIFAGLVSYARAFDAGTRGFKLTPETFKDTWSDADRELHNYLFYLRQKHIAHSVNDCAAMLWA